MWDTILKYQGLIVVFISTISLVISLLNYRFTRRSKSSLASLEEVVSPIFELLEPHMGKTKVHLTPKTLEAITDIIITHPLSAGGRYREFRALDVSDVANFKRLCRKISADYDKHCRMNNIKLRSVMYRFQRYAPRFAIGAIISLSCRLIVYAVLLMLIVFSVVVLVGSSYTNLFNNSGSLYDLVIVCSFVIYLIYFIYRKPKQSK